MLSYQVLERASLVGANPLSYTHFM